MLPLATAAFPASSEELLRSIQEGLLEHHLNARKVVVESSAFPQVELLSIDLSGATLRRDAPVPKARRAGNGELQIGEFEVRAHPLLLEGMPAQLDLSARQAVFHEGHGAKGEIVLLLQTAAKAALTLQIAHSDLESLIQSLATEAAAKQGAEILETHIAFTARGPQSLSFRGDVVAKMFFKVELSFSGDLDLDDHLNLRISNLASKGSGMAAGLAANFLRPYFTKLQEKPIPLTAVDLGGLKPTSINVKVGDTLSLAAEFGS